MTTAVISGMRRRLPPLLTRAVFAALCALTATAAEFYVATTGSDTAAGTAEAPFATIAHAVSEAGEGDVIHVANAAGAAFPYGTRETAATTIDAAYDVLWKNASTATTIDVAPGDYALTKTITLTTPVTFRGSGRDRTVISGGRLG